MIALLLCSLFYNVRCFVIVAVVLFAVLLFSILFFAVLQVRCFVVRRLESTPFYFIETYFLSMGSDDPPPPPMCKKKF